VTRAALAAPLHRFYITPPRPSRRPSRHSPFDLRPDTWRHFYYNNDWQLLETRKTTSAENDEPQTLKPHRQFVWSVRYLDALILRDENKDDDDDCIDGQDERLYYLSDANFNVTALVREVNGHWGVAERYAYDPYGNVTVLDGGKKEIEPDTWVYFDADGDVTEWDEDTGGSDWANTILFAGYWRDSETGLYRVRNRMYHVKLGLWLQRDPEGYVDGMSLYEYVRSAPVRARDPEGLRVTKYVNCNDGMRKAIYGADKAATKRAQALQKFFKEEAYKRYQDIVRSGKGKYAKGADPAKVDAAVKAYCATMAATYGRVAKELDRGYVAVGSHVDKKSGDGRVVAEARQSSDKSKPGTVVFHEGFFDPSTDMDMRAQVFLHEASHLVGVKDGTGLPYGIGNKSAKTRPGKFMTRMAGDAYHIDDYAPGAIPRGRVPKPKAYRYRPKDPVAGAKDAGTIMEVEVIQYAVDPDFSKWKPNVEYPYATQTP
jgi:RHS repeat-associated protein